MSAPSHSSPLRGRYDGVIFPALNRSPELFVSRRVVPALMVLFEPSRCLLALSLIVLACRCLSMCRGQLVAAVSDLCLVAGTGTSILMKQEPLQAYKLREESLNAAVKYCSPFLSVLSAQDYTS